MLSQFEQLTPEILSGMLNHDYSKHQRVFVTYTNVKVQKSISAISNKLNLTVQDFEVYNVHPNSIFRDFDIFSFSFRPYLSNSISGQIGYI